MRLSGMMAIAFRQPNNLLKINRITNVEIKSVSQHSRKPFVGCNVSCRVLHHLLQSNIHPGPERKSDLLRLHGVEQYLFYPSNQKDDAVLSKRFNKLIYVFYTKTEMRKFGIFNLIFSALN